MRKEIGQLPELTDRSPGLPVERGNDASDFGLAAVKGLRGAGTLHLRFGQRLDDAAIGPELERAGLPAEHPA